MWPNHAKVIKSTAPKVALMKGIHLDRQRGLWWCDILTNENNIWQLLQKLLGIKFEWKKIQNMTYLFFRFKIYIIDCVKSVRIRSYSGTHFSRIFSHSDWVKYKSVEIINLVESLFKVRMQENVGKMRTRITSNTDTSYGVIWSMLHSEIN